MPTILDCSSIESTIASLSTIVGINGEAIREFVKTFDCNAYVNEHPDDHRHLRELLPYLLQDKGAILRNPDIVCWFHGTRVVDPETIRTVGLISLQQRIPQIWQDLFDLARDWVSEEQWQSFRAQVETQDHHESSVRFRNRMHNVFDGGPHAVLIRDAIADHARFDGVDYLSAPETIEDLCESFKIHNQRDLLGKFQTESVPCIVKFQDQCRRDDLVGVALSYLWCTSHGEPCLTCNACLEGDRNTIPADAIIEVERIDERR